MGAASSLRLFAVMVLAGNAVATVVAVVVNLPSQFGIVGTDAGREFLTSGTAISAPLLPVVMLLGVVALAERRDWGAWIGIGFGYVAALTVGIGGLGEMRADPTEDTSRAVLVGAGLVWLTVAVALAALSTAAVVSRRRA